MNVVYTSIFGGYDDFIDDQYRMPNTDYICFTDEKIQSTFWDVIVCEPESIPVRDAKKFKVLPHRYLKEYEYSIWMDGNLQLKSDVSHLIDGCSFIRHPHRNCVYKEFMACVRCKKDDPHIMQKQVRRYRKNRYPSRNGMTSSCFIIRKHNDMIKVNEDWWAEIEAGSYRDQLSWNYVAHKNKFPFRYLEFDPYDNEYFQLYKHGTYKHSLQS